MYLQSLTVVAALGLVGFTIASSNGAATLGTDPVAMTSAPTSNATLERGKLMFNISCSPCHGADGSGNGPIEVNLRNSPRDLRRGIYLNRSTASGQLPTDYDLYRTITSGIHNTAMPPFKAMAPGDRWSIVQYIKMFSSRFADSTEYPLDVLNVGAEVLPSPQSLAKGRTLYLQMQCANCHGIRGQGDGPAAGTHVDDFGNQIMPTDLTNLSNFKFGRSALDIFRIFSTGLNGTPMPSYAQTLSETDRWHLANYVWSLQNTDQYMDGAGADSILMAHGSK